MKTSQKQEEHRSLVLPPVKKLSASVKNSRSSKYCTVKGQWKLLDQTLSCIASLGAIVRGHGFSIRAV